MLQLSADTDTAARQWRGLVLYLLTLAHVDGHAHTSEIDFVRRTLGDVMLRRLRSGIDGAVPDDLPAAEERMTRRLERFIAGESARVAEVLRDSISVSEGQRSYLNAWLKTRCYELFAAFDEETQAALLDLADALIRADGEIHPAELSFRAELVRLLDARVEIDLQPVETPHPVAILAAEIPHHDFRTHPLLDDLEVPFDADDGVLERQIRADGRLIGEALELWTGWREAGEGKLTGRRNVADLVWEGPFLDGSVHWIPRRPGGSYEVTVLGDLHGCYSCLKAALMQSRFLERVDAYRAAPDDRPMPLLVLLGDYLDRGRFGLDGVLRAALMLQLHAPDHVVILRGNHELLLEHEGLVGSAVSPAESVDAVRWRVPPGTLADHVALTDAMPTALLFDRVLMVHGGLPRDRWLREELVDLASLNDPRASLEMLWSDPSVADVIPAALQEESVRFAFGRLQLAQLLRRIGCHTLIRGHEPVQEGFRPLFGGDHDLVLTLQSGGGVRNHDLPEESEYRSVQPMALTLRALGGPGAMAAEPWAIDYAPYNHPSRNGFYAAV